MLNTQVLVLNQNYEPMTVTDVKKAVVLIYLGKAEIIERNDGLLVRSVSVTFPLPSIVRLMHYKRVPRKRIILTRKNIIKRDGYQCQYCSTKTGPFTIDHIIPKRSGGEDSWENLVCACIECNNKKRDRTPEEAGMTLLRKPKKPSHLYFIRYFVSTIDHRWKPYLFMN
ncbi:HNH endonuclease [candidate division KSB1 bacterium]|nr:HNH endonuclease [candidate division KSB1 bacterium]